MTGRVDEDSPNPLDRLGQKIIFGWNAYSKHSRPQRENNWDTTIPNNDNTAGKNWSFRAETFSIQSSLLLPYYITDSDGDQVGEHLLFGWSSTGVAEAPANWPDITIPANFAVDTAKLAKIILFDRNPFGQSNQVVRKISGWPSKVRKDFRWAEWSHGALRYRIEKSVVVPWCLVTAGPTVRHNLLVGYVGGGGY